MSKQRDLRIKCRERWGPQWWKVHPVMKKARLQWALTAAGVQVSAVGVDRVRVTEADGSSYVV